MPAALHTVKDSGLLLLKVALVAALVAGIPLLARRFGHGFAGMIIGLPLTAGPTLVLIALKNGAPFAARTAVSSLASLVAVECFILAYAAVSTVQARGRITRAAMPLALGIACFVAVGSLLAGAEWRVATALPAALAALASGAWLTRRFDVSVSISPSPAALTFLRALAAGVVVVTLSELSTRLGPTWAGLLGTYPLAFSITATFAHLDAGGVAARAMAAGCARGCIGLVSFFTIFALLAPNAGVAWSTMLGSALALAALVPVQHLFARHGSAPVERGSAI